MGLEVEPWHGVVGLGLEEGGEIRPSAAGRNPGIRPRSIRLATSEVMNTVLPARDSPVTPRRITGSKRAS